MKRDYGIMVFGFMEIGIGLITLVAIITSLIFKQSAKPPGVLAFVLFTSLVSFGVGLGLLRYNLVAYQLLLYFATVIIFSKVLVFTQVISLSGALETHIPPTFKNIVSMLYHSLVIYYFIQPSVRKQFEKKK